MTPTTQAGNPSCPAGAPYTFRIDNISESQLARTWTSSSPGVSVAPAVSQWSDVAFTISSVDTGAHTFNWQASEDGEELEVNYVIVKGGPSANVYAYDPVSASGSGLHAPVDKGSRYFGHQQHHVLPRPADARTIR